MKRVDPATKQCEQGGKWNRCSAQAAGYWDITTGRIAKSKWLCLGHAIWWNVSRNPQQAVFEDAAR